MSQSITSDHIIPVTTQAHRDAISRLLKAPHRPYVGQFIAADFGLDA